MNKRIEKALEAIARNHLLFDTLSNRNTPDDFNEVAVWSVRKALEEAYRQGFNDGQKQLQPQLQRKPQTEGETP